MSRSSWLVWKSARQNVVALPDCPDDLSEPQYAALMFETLRSVTLSEETPGFSPYLLVCTCQSLQCVSSVLQVGFDFLLPLFFTYEIVLYYRFMKTRTITDRWSSARDYPTILAYWIPFIKVFHKVEEDVQEVKLYILVATDHQWRSEYRALQGPDSKQEWLVRNLEARYVIHKHARACAVWHMAAKKYPNATLHVHERNKQILDYVNEKGFEEDLYKLPPFRKNPLDSPHFVHLWLFPYPNSESALSSLIGPLTLALETYGKVRDALESEALFKIRKPLVSKIYDKTIRTVPAPYPTLGSFYSITVLHDLIDYSKPSKDALRIPFNAVIALWRDTVDANLIKLIRTACPEYIFDTNTVFDLATTAFICSGVNCDTSRNRTPLLHDDAMVHPCTVLLSRVQRTFKNVFGSNAVWCDTTGELQFCPDSLRMMQGIVALCGLDPAVTTAREMDELDPIFEYDVRSEVEKRARTVLKWKNVPQHQTCCHDNYTDIETIRLLTAPEAANVRNLFMAEKGALSIVAYSSTL
ncbi:hypothetical protein BDN70DRAFT_935311 [Pholiota conissans]|uniref:Uncharacterized protein n=1 Tax=Pholiota conissans TaxID=109636 RepID=A0A9P5YX02_9AGAR|nr:hypothetical protein BDN70DRAFT_935311 [Pholiota conissans]